jgi:hypothetical protein
MGGRRDRGIWVSGPDGGCTDDACVMWIKEGVKATEIEGWCNDDMT